MGLEDDEDFNKLPEADKKNQSGSKDKREWEKELIGAIVGDKAFMDFKI